MECDENQTIVHRKRDLAKRKGEPNPVVWTYLEEIFKNRAIALKNGSLISGDNSAWNYSEENWRKILQKITRNIELVEYKPPDNDRSKLPLEARYCWCSTYKASSSSNKDALKSFSQEELIAKGIGYCQLNVDQFEDPIPSCKRGQHVLMHAFVQWENQKAYKLQQYLKKGHWEVTHLCNHERCVNPWHSQFKSHKENELDKTMKNAHIDQVFLVMQIRAQILEELNLIVKK